MRIPDVYEQWERHDMERCKELAKRPVCVECEQEIQEDTAFYINGEWLCESCADSYRREVLPE